MRKSRCSPQQTQCWNILAINRMICLLWRQWAPLLSSLSRRLHSCSINRNTRFCSPLLVPLCESILWSSNLVDPWPSTWLEQSGPDGTTPRSEMNKLPQSCTLRFSVSQLMRHLEFQVALSGVSKYSSWVSILSFIWGNFHCSLPVWRECFSPSTVPLRSHSYLKPYSPARLPVHWAVLFWSWRRIWNMDSFQQFLLQNRSSSQRDRSRLHKGLSSQEDASWVPSLRCNRSVATMKWLKPGKDNQGRSFEDAGSV